MTTLHPRKKTTSVSPTALRGGSLPGGSPRPFFNNGPMLMNQGIILGTNFLGFVISLVAPSCHYHVDLLGTGAFVLATLPTLLKENACANPLTRVQWSSAAVVTWGVKLAGFLFYRIISSGHDSRLDLFMKEPSQAAIFWSFSAFWGIFCALPHTLGTTSRAVGNPLALRAGAAVFGVGLITETLADYQKWMFKANHPGQFCNVGLWSVSQHPNWLGNLILWSGIFVMNAPALIEPVAKGASNTILQKVWSCRRLAFAFLSPAFMYWLFSNQANGNFMAEVHDGNLKKYGYGKDPVFTKYIDTTPHIFPNPFKWWSS